MIGRRDVFRNEQGPAADPGTAASDLAKLLDLLKVDRRHLAGSAKGSAIETHFAAAMSGRAGAKENVRPFAKLRANGVTELAEVDRRSNPAALRGQPGCPPSSE